MAKDDVAEYLRRYADHHGIRPRFGVSVGGWTATAPAGGRRPAAPRCGRGRWCSPPGTTTSRSARPSPADSGAASVRLAVRDPLNRLLQRRFVGDLTRYGLPAAHQGVVAQMRRPG
ncbi:MAG TPA: hypothetical protein VGN47_03415 [Blastococcus sp.]|nr:hypothetical protein [Blastococcus sp.]